MKQYESIFLRIWIKVCRLKYCKSTFQKNLVWLLFSTQFLKSSLLKGVQTIFTKNIKIVLHFSLSSGHCCQHHTTTPSGFKGGDWKWSQKVKRMKHGGFFKALHNRTNAFLKSHFRFTTLYNHWKHGLWTKGDRMCVKSFAPIPRRLKEGVADRHPLLYNQNS